MLKKLLKNMSFRTKILSTLLILTFVLSGFSLILVQSIDKVNQVSNKIKQKNIPELYWLSKWDEELSVKGIVVNDFLEESKCCELSAKYQSVEDTQESESGYSSPKIPSSLNNINKRMELLDFMIVNNVQGLLDYHDQNGAKEFIESNYLPQYNLLKEEIKKAKENTYSKLDGHSNEFSAIIKNSLWLLIFVTIIAIGLSIFAAYRISANLTKPVESMINKVDRIANGQYGLTLNSSEQAEFEQLTNSINQMSIKLKDSFNTILNDKLYREQILNSLPVGIITINDTSTEISVNKTATKILGMDEQQLKQLFITQGDRKNEFFWEILSSKTVYKHTKVPFITSEGTKLLLVSQAEVLNQQQKVIGRVKNFVDITETEELEKRMNQSEKLAAVGEIAAGAAHEIRNPLTVVHGFLSLMNQSFSEKVKDQYHMSLIMKEIERINSIIEEMLLLSKPGAPIRKNIYLQHIMEEFLPLIIQSSEDIEFIIDLHPIQLSVDPKQIKQVFHNLIRNSIEAMCGKGVIHIYSELTESSYRIYLKDSGSGIPLDMQKTIFEPFVSSKDNGTGLGLMIVKRIVENHQGMIFIQESSADGTIFVLDLPLNK
ncbi:MULTISPECIES: sensor histidine kinase [Bacillaceae]|uniref:sensor histidine kinase n=1 Tax=Bacillaceae TaxID=186817 RepID=UPI001E4BFA86|nr:MULTISPECIES: ATP-binding protein [Bacillaceae]UGB31374.1 ATP-binding protein [Metabacillus sp. B2-18]